MTLGLALALLLASAPSTGPGSALSRAARATAFEALGEVPTGSIVGVHVEASTPELAQAAQSLLLQAVHELGAKAAVPIAGASSAEAEARARAAGVEHLLRVRVGLEGIALTFAGDRISTWVNFWDGRATVRQAPPKILAVREPADAEALTLARVVSPTSRAPALPPHYALTPLFQLPAQVLALALLDADDDGHPELVALTPAGLLLLRLDGGVLARRDLAGLPPSPHPARWPSGALVAKGHQLTCAFSGLAQGEALTVDGQGFHPVGPLSQAPLCEGLTANPVAGTTLYGPEVALGERKAQLPRAVLGVRAEGPGKGWLALYPDGTAQRLDAGLTPEGALLTDVGEAALADLDGDGKPELIASSGHALGERDLVRVFASGSVTPLFTSAPIAGAILASAVGELDGRTAVILAALQPDGTSTLLRLGMQP